MADQKISPKVAEDASEQSNDITQTKPLWTVNDVAHYLKLQPETIREMARNENLPAIKLGRIWRFPKDKIKCWVEEKMVGNNPVNQEGE
ncbi:MAG: helix-turn-helix domain-containing protein [Chloroflexi bacterium]|nr:helix-turn-helix domain-containing protein [Chloroflexota bacterium]